MINLLLGSASVGFGKFLCAPYHTGTQHVALLQYDTLCMRIYHIIPPLHIITNSNSHLNLGNVFNV